MNLTANNDTIIGANAIRAERHQRKDGKAGRMATCARGQSNTPPAASFSSVEAYAYLNDYNDILVDSGADLKAGGDIKGGLQGVDHGRVRGRRRTYALFGIPGLVQQRLARGVFQYSDSVSSKALSGINHHRTLHIDAAECLGNIRWNSTGYRRGCGTPAKNQCAERSDQ